MTNKRYDPSLAHYDEQSKLLLPKLFGDLTAGQMQLLKINESENPQERFKEGFWDQLYFYKGKEIYAEGEMKDAQWWGRQWIGKYGYPFKYDTMDIPFRKSKNKAAIHTLISTDELFGAIVYRKKMDAWLEIQPNKRPKFKRTKFEPDGAHYYAIPVDDCVFVEKVNNRWQVFKKDEK